ncbi:MAG: hypothetical protein KKB39_03945 [Nanoarchaeota archaeon]|nr:hypothetical protein [Nanoarchaeota archaeon]
MKTLESKISEQDLVNARKDFGKLGLISHFWGEGIGFLYFTSIKGAAIPVIESMINDTYDPDFNYQAMGIGLAIYGIAQIAALLFKGLSLTKEENRELAERFAKEPEYGGMGNWFKREYSDFHLKFSENAERHDKKLKVYIRFKKRLKSLFSKSTP